MSHLQFSIQHLASQAQAIAAWRREQELAALPLYDETMAPRYLPQRLVQPLLEVADALCQQAYRASMPLTMAQTLRALAEFVRRLAPLVADEAETDHHTPVRQEGGRKGMETPQRRTAIRGVRMAAAVRGCMVCMEGGSMCPLYSYRHAYRAT